MVGAVPVLDRVTYYNKEAYAAAGLDPEAPPTTWVEMT